MLLIALLATLPFPDEYRDEVRDVMSLALTEKFTKADSVAKKVKEDLPDSPLGSLLRMAVIEFKMTDWSTDDGEEDFMAEFDRVNEMTKKAIKEEKDPKTKAKAHLFRGFALGFKAVHYARRYQEVTNVLRGLKYGKEALDEITRAQELDSTLYDCYLAMGIYDLAISYAQKKVPWIQSENRKKKGMAELSVATEKSELFKPVAFLAYVYVYMYEGNPDLALQYLKFLKTSYPGSRTLMWLEVEVYLENERWYYAEESGQALLAEVEKRQPTCYVNQAEAHIYLARARYHLGAHPAHHLPRTLHHHRRAA
ncbi:MAG: hypothetical protein ACPL68_05840, partial [Candidatus Hydrothermia bacterium]